MAGAKRGKRCHPERKEKKVSGYDKIAIQYIIIRSEFGTDNLTDILNETYSRISNYLKTIHTPLSLPYRRSQGHMWNLLHN